MLDYYNILVFWTMENMHLKLISLLVKCLTICFSVLISSILFKEKKKHKIVSI